MIISLFVSGAGWLDAEHVENSKWTESQGIAKLRSTTDCARSGFVV